MLFKVIESSLPLLPIPDEIKNEVQSHLANYLNERYKNNKNICYEHYFLTKNLVYLQH